MKKYTWVFLVAVFLLGGCTSTRTLEGQVAEKNDPIESVNRVMWDFNWEILDKHILRPAAVAYVDYVPSVARTGLSNAANNLGEPGNAINNLLQGKLTESVESSIRFVVNSTIGIFGLIDVAKHMGLEHAEEDFGQTLGVWGSGTGAYVMFPGAGPSDVRSTTGTVVDNLYWPLADLNVYFNVARGLIGALETRAQLIEQEQLIYDSLDSYSMIKNIHFQNLQNQVYDGNPPISDAEDEEDEELDALLDDL